MSGVTADRRPSSLALRTLRVLRELAEAGQDLPPTPRMAEKVGLLDYAHLSGAYAEGERLGWWKFARTDVGHIIAIWATDGTWCLNGSAAPRGGDRGLPPRRCLRCRLEFRPEHRGNFLCRPCGVYAERVG